MSGFNDQFSSIARLYAEFRPRYPVEWFEYLAGRSPDRVRAWDCATGSGQAALGLVDWFDHVVATDASPAQIAAATPHPRIEYRVALAERSGLPSDFASAITVGQAMHWLDPATFYSEADRVARDGAIVAVWGYNLLSLSPELDPVVERFYYHTMRSWWSPERRLVDEQYRTLPWPWEELPMPEVRMTAEWRLLGLLGYLSSWSAVRRYREARGDDPVAAIAGELSEAWGPAERERTVTWPLFGRVGRIRKRRR